MAATRRQMNWTSTSFTPSGGSLTAIDGVTQVAVPRGGSLQKFSGDGDRFNTTVVADFEDPTVTITTASLAAIMAFTIGQRGSVTTTHKDAKLATGGSMVYVLSNAVVADIQVGGSHRQFGSGTISFAAESADGTTNPLAFTLT